MRVSLVTETYFPQVNGVSRTLGELVRHLTERGDQVQLIHPDYGQPPAGEQVHLVRSVNLPFYKELFLPLPPFGSVRRAIDAFRPDLVHIATEATLGLSVLRHLLRRKIAHRLELPHQLRPVQPALPSRLGQGNDLALSALVSQPDRETYVPSRTTIQGLQELGFERLVLWPRGVTAPSSGQTAPGGTRFAAGWAGAPTIW